MTFILCLILINALLFLPRYLLSLPKGWLPFSFLGHEKPLKMRLGQLAYSNNLDPFRLSVEYSALALILFSLGISSVPVLWLLGAVAVLVFVFNVYYAVFLNVFHKTPLIQSDLLFLRDCISIYKGYFIAIGSVSLLLLVGLVYGFFLLTQHLSGLPALWPLNMLLLAYILGWEMYKARRYTVSDYPLRAVFSVLVFLVKSYQHNLQFKKLLDIPEADIRRMNHFKGVSLEKKPNIHIISMECYGSVLFKNPSKYEKPRASLRHWAEEFAQSDLKVCSHYATPPLFGVGTWFSYSTLLFGMKIDDGDQHNVLFKEMQQFRAYESLFQFTRREGYTNYLLHGMLGEYSNTLDFSKVENNLNYDVFISKDEMDYRGQRLKFMSTQDCVPDQYALHKGMDVVKQGKSPYTMFYCTLNSHWQYYAPMSRAANWQDLNDSSYKFPTTLDGKMNLYERYCESMDYTIHTVFDWMQERAGDHDIFVVYGDHQPHKVADERFGKDTPIHIFSKDQAFLDLFKEYGFHDGLWPQEGGEALRLEAFYSMFMRCLNKRFGKDKDLDLPFFKKGLKLEV